MYHLNYCDDVAAVLRDGCRGFRGRGGNGRINGHVSKAICSPLDMGNQEGKINTGNWGFLASYFDGTVTSKPMFMSIMLGAKRSPRRVMDPSADPATVSRAEMATFMRPS